MLQSEDISINIVTGHLKILILFSITYGEREFESDKIIAKEITIKFDEKRIIHGKKDFEPLDWWKLNSDF